MTASKSATVPATKQQQKKTIPTAPTPTATEATTKPVLAERYKTRMCRNYEETGKCPYESRCMFAHGDDEVRTTDQNIEDDLITEEAIKAFQRQLMIKKKQQEIAAKRQQRSNNANNNADSSSSSASGQQKSHPMPSARRQPRNPTVQERYIPAPSTAYSTQQPPASYDGYNYDGSYGEYNYNNYGGDYSYDPYGYNYGYNYGSGYNGEAPPSEDYPSGEASYDSSSYGHQYPSGPCQCPDCIALQKQYGPTGGFESHANHHQYDEMEYPVEAPEVLEP